MIWKPISLRTTFSYGIKLKCSAICKTNEIDIQLPHGIKDTCSKSFKNSEYITKDPRFITLVS